MSFPPATRLTEAEIEAVAEVLRSGRLALGPKCRQFERDVAQYVGCEHGVAVSSGTAGLHLAVAAAGLGPGDEVITSPFSFVPSSNCLLYEGAQPVFVDIETISLGPDPAAVEAAITPRTRALLTIDLFHQPVDTDPLAAIAKAHELLIIEDACEALGAEYKGRRAGSLGDIGVFGFYPNKQITTGEGGMIVTHHAELAERCRSLRNQGRDSGDGWLTHSRIGFNYRLDEMSAALGVAQMARIDALIQRRDELAAAYGERLAAVAGVTRPTVAPTTTRTSWFIYAVQLAPELDRRQVIAALQQRGVPARPYFECIHLQKPYRERFGFREGQFPVAEAYALRNVALPLHANMTEEHVEQVVSALIEVVG